MCAYMKNSEHLTNVISLEIPNIITSLIFHFGIKTPLKIEIKLYKKKIFE